MKEGLEPRWLGAFYHIYSIAATNFTNKKNQPRAYDYSCSRSHPMSKCCSVGSLGPWVQQACRAVTKIPSTRSFLLLLKRLSELYWVGDRSILVACNAKCKLPVDGFIRVSESGRRTELRMLLNTPVPHGLG
jgi:hypothetical protein